MPPIISTATAAYGGLFVAPELPLGEWVLSHGRPHWIAMPAAPTAAPWGLIDLRGCDDKISPKPIALPRTRERYYIPTPGQGGGRPKLRDADPGACLRAAVLTDIFGMTHFDASRIAGLAHRGGRKPSSAFRKHRREGQLLGYMNGIWPWAAFPDGKVPANWHREPEAVSQAVSHLEDWAVNGWQWADDPGDPTDARVIPPHLHDETYSLAEFIAWKDALIALKYPLEASDKWRSPARGMDFSQLMSLAERWQRSKWSPDRPDEPIDPRGSKVGVKSVFDEEVQIPDEDLSARVLEHVVYGRRRTNRLKFEQANDKRREAAQMETRRIEMIMEIVRAERASQAKVEPGNRLRVTQPAI